MNIYISGLNFINNLFTEYGEVYDNDFVTQTLSTKIVQ